MQITEHQRQEVEDLRLNKRRVLACSKIYSIRQKGVYRIQRGPTFKLELTIQ